MWASFRALSIGAKALVIAAILALLASAFFAGYTRGSSKAPLEIIKYETKIKEKQVLVEQEQKKVDVRAVVEYKDKIHYVDRVVYKNRDIVIEKVPEQFTLSKGWIYAYNQSVQGLTVDPALASDATPSTVTEMKALANTIMPNNGICLANKAQLEGLQNWVRGTQEAYEKANNN